MKETNLNKRDVFDSLLLQLKEDLEVLVRSATEAKEASTHEDAKAENKYDTRGLEASYLASAQSKRASDLQDVLETLNKLTLRDLNEDSPIQLTALVTLSSEDDKVRRLFFLPIGGRTVKSNGVEIQVISMDTPLGKALNGLFVGDEVSWQDQLFVINSIQ